MPQAHLFERKEEEARQMMAHIIGKKEVKEEDSEIKRLEEGLEVV